MKPQVWNKRDPNVPKDAIYVGRPTEWGNTFKIGLDGDRQLVIDKYRTHLSAETREAARQLLRGKHLVCWCAPQPCHADVLLEIANHEPDPDHPDPTTLDLDDHFGRGEER